MKVPGKFKGHESKVNAQSFHKCLQAIKSDKFKFSKSNDGKAITCNVLQDGNLFIYTTEVTDNFQAKPKPATVPELELK